MLQRGRPGRPLPCPVLGRHPVPGLGRHPVRTAARQPGRLGGGGEPPGPRPLGGGGGGGGGRLLMAPMLRAVQARASCTSGRETRSGTGHPPVRRAGSPVGSATVNRQCSRPGCAEPAEATLTYHYARSVAWLDALSAERDPARLRPVRAARGRAAGAPWLAPRGSPRALRPPPCSPAATLGRLRRVQPRLVASAPRASSARRAAFSGRSSPSRVADRRSWSRCSRPDRHPVGHGLRRRPARRPPAVVGRGAARAAVGRPPHRRDHRQPALGHRPAPERLRAALPGLRPARHPDRDRSRSWSFVPAPLPARSSAQSI